jgi:hypothetical protein
MLGKRFEMTSWFTRHGYPVEAHAAPDRPPFAKSPSADSLLLQHPCAPPAQQQQQAAATRFKKHTLFLADFDKTLIDHDAGELRSHLPAWGERPCPPPSLLPPALATRVMTRPYPPPHPLQASACWRSWRPSCCPCSCRSSRPPTSSR